MNREKDQEEARPSKKARVPPPPSYKQPTSQREQQHAHTRQKQDTHKIDQVVSTCNVFC